MTREDIENILRQAWSNLLLDQPDFGTFTPRTSQRELNIAHHYANYVLPLIKTRIEQISCDFDVWKGEIHKRPDIVFHTRGNDSNNFLVLELKVDGSQQQKRDELSRIREHWLNGFDYRFGAYVNVSRSSKELLDLTVLDNTP